MLAAAACKPLALAFLLLLLGCIGLTSAAPGDVAAAAVGPAATGLCEEPVVLEPGLNSVYCISPAIRMNPGQVCELSMDVLSDSDSFMSCWVPQAVLQHYPAHVQVININLLYPNPFPADQTVAIINQTAQLIHVADRMPVTPNEVRSPGSVYACNPELCRLCSYLPAEVAQSAALLPTVIKPI